MKEIIKKILRESLICEKTMDKSLVFSDLYQYKYNGFYSNFNENELLNIIKFLNAVIARTNSGLGVGIGKETLNKLFFNTPLEFRNYYQQKPTPNLWRGDTIYPCESKYEDDFYLQSYSTKSTASFFGDVIWPSTMINTYGGSFSTIKFNKSLKSSDYWYLKAVYFYILSKENSQYSKLFSLDEFYPIYYTLMGKGIIGRKYKNWLLKYLKTNGLDFNRDEYRYDNEIEIGDDEGEVMFFNVEYNCEKLKNILKNT